MSPQHTWVVSLKVTRGAKSGSLACELSKSWRAGVCPSQLLFSIGRGPSGSGPNENEFVLAGALFLSTRSTLENRPSEAGGATVKWWVWSDNMNWRSRDKDKRAGQAWHRRCLETGDPARPHGVASARAGKCVSVRVAHFCLGPPHLWVSFLSLVAKWQDAPGRHGKGDG